MATRRTKPKSFWERHKGLAAALWTSGGAFVGALALVLGGGSDVLSLMDRARSAAPAGAVAAQTPPPASAATPQVAAAPPPAVPSPPAPSVPAPRPDPAVIALAPDPVPTTRAAVGAPAGAHTSVAPSADAAATGGVSAPVAVLPKTMPMEFNELRACARELPLAEYNKIIDLIREGRITAAEAQKLINAYQCQIYGDLTRDGPGRIRAVEAARLSKQFVIGLTRLLNDRATRPATLQAMEQRFSTASVARLDKVERASRNRILTAAWRASVGPQWTGSASTGRALLGVFLADQSPVGVAELIQWTRRDHDLDPNDPLLAYREAGIDESSSAMEHGHIASETRPPDPEREHPRQTPRLACPPPKKGSSSTACGPPAQ